MSTRPWPRARARARSRAGHARRACRRTGPSSRRPRRSTASRWRRSPSTASPGLAGQRPRAARRRARRYTADTLGAAARDGPARVADFLHHRRRRVRGNRDLEPLSAGPRPGALRRGLAARASGRRAAATAAGAGGADAQPAPASARRTLSRQRRRDLILLSTRRRRTSRRPTSGAASAQANRSPASCRPRRDAHPSAWSLLAQRRPAIDSADHLHGQN